jgi:hypothetical protein
MITSIGPGNKLNWMGNPLPTAISAANFAWGHDDTAAIISAVTSLNNYVDSQSRVVGGSLFFPTSTGCYGITSNIGVISTNSQFLGLTGEGSASSKMLGGPGTLPQQPASACIATILSSAGFTFSSDSGMLNAGPIVERLGFVDPFGVTGTALKFNMNASTRVINNSFQGYAAGKAIWFNAVQTDDTHLKYNQFVEVSDNVCVSVLSCIIMNNGVTNPAWIERNRCVSAQTGGGRCIQLGPNIAPVSMSDPVNLGGATNWIVENFALYYPISFESIDQYADYWIGNSNQQTASLQGGGMSIPNIIGGANSGTGLHVGASVVSVASPPNTICFDNEVFGGNNALNDVGLFIDPLCSKSLYLGYTVANPNNPPLIEDFGTQSTFWNQEVGMSVSAQMGVNPFTVANQNGKTAFQVLANGDLRVDGSTSGVVAIHAQPASGTYNFNLPTTAGTTNQPLLSQGGGSTAMIFGPLPLGSGVSGVLPLANGGTNSSSFLGVGGEVFNTPSAQTNAAISAVTMLIVGGSDTTYRFQYYMTQIDAGTGCTGSTQLTLNLTFTDAVGGASQPVTKPFPTFPLVISGLGVGQSNSYAIRVKASQTVQYSSTYVLGSGCSTGPKYQVFPILEQL